MSEKSNRREKANAKTLRPSVLFGLLKQSINEQT